jgi:hypothetical protein
VQILALSFIRLHRFGDRAAIREIAYAEGVSFDWSCGALAEGLTCYRRAEFFLAHEHWESVWLTLEEPEKSSLQTSFGGVIVIGVSEAAGVSHQKDESQ